MIWVLICAECGAEMVLRDSRYGKFYGCKRFPECRATHGAHQATGEPLGHPADKAAKALRIEAHDQFDKLWKSGHMSRSQAYRWLAKVLKIPKAECHIGMFDQKLCRRAIEACKTK